METLIHTEAGSLFVREWAPARTVGGAAAILLFHDSLGCVELWRDFPSRLADGTGRRVVAYDRLGFGKSDARVGAMPPTFILDEAEHVVPALSAALGLDSIIPLGHSVGGAMAIATAARWPERCGGVVTVSAHGFMEDRIGAGILAARAEFDRPGQFDRLARYHGDKARWVLDTWVDTWTSPDVADWSLDGVLRSLRCPALVLHGDRDEYGSLEQPSRIAGLAGGGATKVILEGCGHFPHRKQPERLVEEVARFLAWLAVVQ